MYDMAGCVCAMLRLILHDEPVLVASDSIILCSITTNTSPHYNFFLGVPYNLAERLGFANMPVQ